MTTTRTFTEAIYVVTTAAGRFEVKARDTAALDDSIARGHVVKARESKSSADEWPFRLNLATVVAYLAEPVHGPEPE